MALDPKVIETLSRVTTATLTTILLKKGLRNVWMRGTRPLAPGQRAPRRARRSRCASCRRARTWRRPRRGPIPISTRAAIEAMPEGCIAVVDAMGVTDAGIFGDILCARMKKRGVAALVTDGVVRDVAGVRGTGLPVWCQGAAAPPSVAGLTFVGWQEPIGCGGVAVFPDDVVVVDDDGAVLDSRGARSTTIVAEAPEQERLEAWIMGEVEHGAAAAGPLPAERREHAPLREDEEMKLSAGRHAASTSSRRRPFHPDGRHRRRVDRPDDGFLREGGRGRDDGAGAAGRSAEDDARGIRAHREARARAHELPIVVGVSAPGFAAMRALTQDVMARAPRA